MGLLFGTILLVVAAGTAVMGGKIFDISRKFSVSSVIFQPGDLSQDRIEKPIDLDTLSIETVRNHLIRKFVHEYFYIVPDAGNMAARRKLGSVLYRMIDPTSPVFKEWDEKFGVDMEKMAGQQILRRVVVNSIAQPPKSEYFQVSYDLLTWDVANDITRAPVASKNKSMFIRLDFEKGLRQLQTNGARFNIKKYLEEGGDPATIFRFRVLEVVVK